MDDRYQYRKSFSRTSAASSGPAPEGRETPKTLTAVPHFTALKPAIPHSTRPPAEARPGRDWRLHRHADYQRVYQSSRKRSASLLTYFAAPQTAECAGAGPRIGITAGKVLGKAVERNRIKRRMRSAIVANLDALHGDVDVVLHPRRAVLGAPWQDLRNEVRRAFVKIAESEAQCSATERKP